MNASEHHAQTKFDQMYITSSEIGERLRVTRPVLHFRRKAGLLPDAILVKGNQMYIWERAAIEPHLVEWEEKLGLRRKETDQKGGDNG